MKSSKKRKTILRKPNVRVYIDGANVFYTQRDLGWIFDWKKLKKVIENNFHCDNFYFYTSLKSKENRQVKQIERLKKWGFQVITKPPKRIKGELKANFDVEISLDIIFTILDGWKGNIVLLSGDSDFAYLVKIIHKRFSRKIFVFSSRKFISWELRYLADKVLLFEDFKKEIFLKNWINKKHLTSVKKGVINRTR